MATGTIETIQDIFNKAWRPAGTSQDSDPSVLIQEAPYRAFTLDSATTATSSATGTTTTGLGGFRSVDVYVRAGTITGTVSTLDLFVDSRLDGTNYVNVGHFSQIASADAGTFDRVMRLVKQPGTPVEVTGLRADAGAGTVRNIGWGNDLRIRRDISGGTTSPTFSYTVTVICLG